MRSHLAAEFAQAGVLCILLIAPACAPKPAPAPPPSPPSPPPAPPVIQNVFALLPEPGGQATGIIVRNQAGAQELSQPYQAVRVARNDTPPSAPYALSEADVRRLFGSAIATLPEPEVEFVLHFDENREVLNAESLAMIPSIMRAIQDRHSTSITVIGHTDTTATPEYNYALGMRRAQGVAAVLANQGVKDSDLFVSSHGDTDLLVRTERNKSEPRNRRVEVIVR
jgi:outer membrane protein OmpA-like peptidoglycan-associated protein